MYRTGGPNKKEELEGTRPGVRGFIKSAISALLGSKSPAHILILLIKGPGYTETVTDAM